MSAPLQRRVSANGISLTIFEWHPEQRGNGDTILLAHATGFHARCWDRTVAHLGERHIVAVDQRGHGRSDKVWPVHWAEFGRDLADLVRVLELRDIVGAGHSMGGHAMVEAAAAEPERFRRLVLIDPVIASPDDYAKGSWRADVLGEARHPTAKRRNRWTSAEEMFERFKDRPPFSAFDPAVLHDYCEYGLLRDPSGDGFILACPPDFEAEVYMTSRGNAGVYDSIHAVEISVLIVRAMEPTADRDVMDFRYSPTYPGLVRHFRRGREIHLPGHTHFLPMEDPELAAKFVLEKAPPPRAPSPSGRRPG